jgi:hypothetical protein
MSHHKDPHLPASLLAAPLQETSAVAAAVYAAPLFAQLQVSKINPLATLVLLLSVTQGPCKGLLLSLLLAAALQVAPAGLL